MANSKSSEKAQLVSSLNNTFRVTVDEAHLEAATPTLYASSLEQNRALRKLLNPPVLLITVLYFVLVVVLWALFVVGSLALVVGLLTPEAERHEVLLVACAAVAGFLGVFALHWFGLAGFRWFHDYNRDVLSEIPVKPLIRWAAGAAISQTKALAPFDAEYELTDHELRITIEKAEISKQVRVDEIAIAYSSPEVIVFYNGPTNQKQHAVAYFDSIPQAEAFAAWLAANDIESVETASLRR